MAADDAGRVHLVAGPFDVDGTFVDDDHQQNLRRVFDRREPLQDLDVVEPFRGPEPGRDLVHGVRIDQRADLDARETTDLVVLGDGVAVDLNRRNGLAALPRRSGREGGRPAHEQQNDRCPHGQRILTLVVTSGRR